MRPETKHQAPGHLTKSPAEDTPDLVTGGVWPQLTEALHGYAALFWAPSAQAQRS